MYAHLERPARRLEAYRQALAVDPGFEHARKAIKALEAGGTENWPTVRAGGRLARGGGRSIRRSRLPEQEKAGARFLLQSKSLC